MNKRNLVIAAAAVAICAKSYATSLGSSGVVGGYRLGSELSIGGLDGVPLNGQTISFDVSFGGQFIRAFTATKILALYINIPLDGAVIIPNPLEDLRAAGSGYFTDKNGHMVGQPVGLKGLADSPIPVNGFPPFTAEGVSITGLLSLGVARPIDLYGFHYDFFYDLPGTAIKENGPFASVETIEISGARHAFGIGPGKLPVDLVPDGGNTIFYLTGTTVALMVLKGRNAKDRNV